MKEIRLFCALSSFFLCAYREKNIIQLTKWILPTAWAAKHPQTFIFLSWFTVAKVFFRWRRSECLRQTVGRRLHLRTKGDSSDQTTCLHCSTVQFLRAFDHASLANLYDILKVEFQPNERRTRALSSTNTVQASLDQCCTIDNYVQQVLDSE